jgi:DNA polymerase V
MIRLHFAVMLERTVVQLQGMACLALEDVAPPKSKSCRRSAFGRTVLPYVEPGEAPSPCASREALFNSH